jgi:hypothetical protein
MKTNLKLLSLFLVLAMLLSATPVLAAEGDQTVPVDLTVEEPIFSVTVPIALPITITEQGEILTSDTAAVINNSAGPVVITDIQTKGINGWETVAFGSIDMASAKVNTKNVSLQLIFGDKDRGTIVNTTGEDTNDFTGFIRLAKDETLPLLYDAEVPAQTTAYESAQIAEVIFTVGWDE